MENKSREGKRISRRGILPLFGSALLIPFLSIGNTNNNEIIIAEDDLNYETLLKPDGSTVKVKVSTLKKAKVIKKRMSNKFLLNWLNKK